MTAKEIATETAFHCTSGVVRYLAFLLIVIGLLNLAFNGVRWLFHLGMDDSDSYANGRSGFKVLTDYKTGVQYLVTTEGHAVVRVDSNGRPLTFNANDRSPRP